jgi:hypothetical protein
MLLQAPSPTDQTTKGTVAVANQNRPSVKTRNTSVVTGIDKHVTGNTTIGGVVYTPAALKAVFTDVNIAIDSAEALHKTWQEQVQATRVVSKTANLVFRLLRSFLIGQYGEGAKAILNDFGMETPKPKGAKTVAVKSVAGQKRQATRAARHTMGKVQKKAVKGTKEVSVAPTGGTTQPASPATGGTPTSAPTGGAVSGTKSAS